MKKSTVFGLGLAFLALTFNNACSNGGESEAAHLKRMEQDITRPTTNCHTSGLGDVKGKGLRDQNKKPVDNQTFKNKTLLTFYGFTTCPDVCPIGMEKISKALETLEKTYGKDIYRKIQPVFVTIKPEDDTPEKIKSFLDLHGLDDRMIGVTGDIENILALSRKKGALIEGLPDTNGDGNDERLHASFVYVTTSEGNDLGTVETAGNITPQQIANQLAIVAGLAKNDLNHSPAPGK